MQARLYIFDLDGTLYRGEEAVPFAVEALEALRSTQAEIRFLTNNSSKSCAEIVDKLNSLGFEATEREVYTSAMGAAKRLAEEGLRSAFTVGERGLVDTLAESGIAVVDTGAEAVVAGICRGFDYAWLDRALQNLIAGARFFATNRDRTYPLEQGRLQPGAGAIVASIEACSGVEPVVIGKPEPYLVEWILEDAGVSADDALVVGDRMDTDIEAGLRAGCATLLVGTGVTAAGTEGQPFAQDLRSLFGN